MIEEQAHVSLVALPGGGPCELCTSEASTPTMAVVVQHPRGGVVRLAACAWCVQALRRLSAATGGLAAFAPSEAPGPMPHVLRATPRGRRPAGPPLLIMELTQQIRDADGTEFLVQVYGRGRSDGTWEGWLEFVGAASPVILRTGRETTQSKREDVAYWATGLEPSYVRGAFARARPVDADAEAAS